MYDFRVLEDYLLVQIGNPGNVEVYNPILSVIKTIEGNHTVWYNKVKNNYFLCEGNTADGKTSTRFWFDPKDETLREYPMEKASVLSITEEFVLYRNMTYGFFLTSVFDDKKIWNVTFDELEREGVVIDRQTSLGAQGYIEDDKVILYVMQGGSIVVLNLKDGRILFTDYALTLIGFEKDRLLYQNRVNEKLVWIELETGRRIIQFDKWQLEQGFYNSTRGLPAIIVDDYIIVPSNKNQIYWLSKYSSEIYNIFTITENEYGGPNRIKMNYIENKNLLLYWDSNSRTLRGYHINRLID